MLCTSFDIVTIVLLFLGLPPKCKYWLAVMLVQVPDPNLKEYLASCVTFTWPR